MVCGSVTALLRVVWGSAGLLGIRYYARLLSCYNARNYTRLLDVDLYAKTRTGGWFAAKLHSYTRVLRKAVG